MFQVVAILVFWILAVALVVGWFRQLALRQRGRERFQSLDESAPIAVPVRDESRYEFGWLRQWLFRAGYRRANAAPTFIAAAAACALLGAVVMVVVWQAGLVAQLTLLARTIPGGIADLLVPLAQLLPWMLFLEIAALPAILVHNRRQRLIRNVEQDLPLVLDLLATLSEAGLAFDAAIDRVIIALPVGRPLRDELSAYQTELLAGRRRATALSRLAWRVDVLAIAMFTSAVIHADQVGAGMTAVLRRQAEDLRERRRERALAHAMSTQVKMIVPMIVCFLPGIFIISLGPIFFRFFQMAESMLGRYGM